MNRTEAKQHQRRRRTIKWVLFTLTVFLLASASYVYSVYYRVNETAATIYKPLPKDKKEQPAKMEVLKQRKPISFLLMGVDERSDDRGRSDSLIVVTVNPKSKSIKMVSIPRDTRTEIIGKGFKDKINHSYAYGDVPMTLNTVEHFLNVPINYYIKVNMESFRDIVDALDGITVRNKFQFTAGGFRFDEGPIRLMGEKALVYARMRHQDPRGDFGRQQRQRDVIQAIIKKGTSVFSVTKLDDLLSAISSNIKTNMSLSEMIDIANGYRDSVTTIQQTELKGVNELLNNVYYFEVNEEERLTMSNLFRAHLELPTGANVTRLHSSEARTSQ